MIMTAKQLDELIDELNSNPESPKFIITKIAEFIYFGKFWLNLPWERLIECYGYNFYLIHSSNNNFIGIVSAGTSDMHVFLKPEFRGNGIMSKSLRETIIPHMFMYMETDKLRITIDKEFHGKRFKSVEKSAELAGFKDVCVTDDHLFEYFAYKNEYPEFIYFEEKKKSASEKELRFLHQRINSIKSQLEYMKECYEIFLGENEELISYIKDDITRFEWEYEKKLRSQM